MVGWASKADLVTAPLLPGKGQMELPDKPGLGIVLNTNLFAIEMQHILVSL